MTIEHHPADEMLTAFAAGTLDLGQHVAVATHLVSCSQCRAFRRAMEQVGGEVLASLPPAEMAADALGKIEARLGEAPPPAAKVAPLAIPEAEIQGLPDFVRRYQFGRWKWIAPSVHIRPVV